MPQTLNVAGEYVVKINGTPQIIVTSSGLNGVTLASPTLTSPAISAPTISGTWSAFGATCSDLGTVSAATSITSTAFVGGTGSFTTGAFSSNVVVGSGSAVISASLQSAPGLTIGSHNPGVTFIDTDNSDVGWGVSVLNGAFSIAPVADNGTSGTLALSIARSTGIITCTASAGILSGTSIPAGGTAGAGYRFSSTSNFGVFFGSGAPTLSAAQGSLYLRSDGSGTTDRAYINTDGSTTWTALTTAA